MILAAVIGVIIAIIALRALYVYASIPVFKWYWQHSLEAPITHGDIVVAALGDSTVQGIGALTPSRGFVGQVVGQLDQRSDVKIYNFSRSGAESGEVLKDQLPNLLQLKRVDAVIVAVGPNDITHKKSLDSFLSNYEQILDALPTIKVVVASLPPMGPTDIDGRSSYEWGLELSKLAVERSVRVAPVFERVNERVNDPRTYAGDFYHPSGAGYSLWAEAFKKPLQHVLDN